MAELTLKGKVYVDEIVTYDPKQVAPAARRFGTRWSHLTADHEEDLHAMARAIGVPRSAYQDRSPKTGKAFIPPLRHYDLIPPRRAAAIKLGAIPVAGVAHMREVVARYEAQRSLEAELKHEYNGLLGRLEAVGEGFSGIAAVAGILDGEGLVLTPEALRDMGERMSRLVADRKVSPTSVALVRREPGGGDGSTT